MIRDRGYASGWFGVAVVWLALLQAALAAEAPRMDKDALRERLGNADVVVIDVRTDPDWDASGAKIPGAVRESYGDFDAWSSKFPRDRTLVLYCA